MIKPRKISMKKSILRSNKFPFWKIFAVNFIKFFTNIKKMYLEHT